MGIMGTNSMENIMMSLTDRVAMFQKQHVFGVLLFIITPKTCNNELNIVWVNDFSKFLNLKFKP